MTGAPAGLFGKLPSHGDFIRVGVSTPGARMLAAWIEGGYEQARSAGIDRDPPRCRFVLKVPGTTGAVAGVLHPSVDRVGRRFPVVLFTELIESRLAEWLPVLTEGPAAFFDAADALIEELARGERGDLTASLALVPPMRVDELERAEARLTSASEATEAETVLRRLLGEEAAGQRYYAFHCLLSACRSVPPQEPERARVALECPAVEAIDRWTWLELARRLLPGPFIPSLAWGPSGPAMMLSLGPFSTSVYASLCDPSRSDSKVWPMTTSRTEAISDAKRSLGDVLCAAIGSAHGTLATLLGNVTAGARAESSPRGSR